MRLSTFVLIVVLMAGCGGRQNPEPDAGSPELASAPKGLPKEERGQENGLIVLTPVAAEKLQGVIRQGQADGVLPKEKLYLRARLVDDKHRLDLDPEISPDDRIGESRNIPTVVDHKTAELLAPGILVDYVDLVENGGFKVKSLAEIELGSPDPTTTLVEARRGFKTNVVRRIQAGRVPSQPPPQLFNLVRYESPAGKLHAYMTPDPKDGKKRPAIVWITGGDCNTIDQGCWREGADGNDQSASAYRKAGIVMMFPSQRGGNDNPGTKEAFLGEVEDVVSAAAFLAKQPHVDPERIYLGGHSTGGTLALLVSEYTTRFRAVFSFGPVCDPRNYGPDQTPYSRKDLKEVRLRAPELWLHSIQSPTFVFEGSDQPGNQEQLRRMAQLNKNEKCRFYVVKNANHFNLLSPINRLLAERIKADDGPASNISLTDEEANGAFVRYQPKP